MPRRCAGRSLVPWGRSGDWPGGGGEGRRAPAPRGPAHRKERIMARTLRSLAAVLAAIARLATVGLTAALAADMVPYKARAAGNFVSVDNGNGLHLTGAGNVTFLGAVTSDGHIAFGGFPDSVTGCIPIHDDQVL